MIADYATTGLTLGRHPMALLRPQLPAGTVSCRDLETLAHESRVRIGGLVVARQRPGTAKGIVFLLIEDEFGTVNLIVPPPVYERHRLLVRSEPLVLADGAAGAAAGRGRRDQRLRRGPGAAEGAAGRRSPRWSRCEERRAARPRPASSPTSARWRPRCRASPRGGGDERRCAGPTAVARPNG